MISAVVSRYQGDHYAKKVSCWDEFLTMAFARLACRDCLRGIEACWGAIVPKLYHMDCGSAVAGSTPADADEAAIGASLPIPLRC